MTRRAPAARRPLTEADLAPVVGAFRDGIAKLNTKITPERLNARIRGAIVRHANTEHERVAIQGS